MQSGLEIQVIMINAFWIEQCLAGWTLVTRLPVDINRHFVKTFATKNSFCIKIFFWPDFSSVACSFLMTIITGIIFPTAFKFYRNNIQWPMVMYTTGFVVIQFTFHNYIITHAIKMLIYARAF